MSRREVLLFGASRGAGLALAERLRARGDRVTALARAGAGVAALDALGVATLVGDALDPDAVARAFARVAPGTAVVSLLGGGRDPGPLVDDTGNGHVIDAAVAAGAGPFVLVTAIGCGEMAPHRSERARAAFGAIVDAKTRAEERLRASGLEHAIVRPGGLRDGPPTGRAILCDDPAVHGFVRRSDLAALLDRVLRDPATRGRALAAVDADESRSDTPRTPFPLAL